jgi:hypothetical protein
MGIDWATVALLIMNAFNVAVALKGIYDVGRRRKREREEAELRHRMEFSLFEKHHKI